MKPVDQETIEDVKSCIKAIFAHDYFVHYWESVAHHKALEECNMQELLQPFQDFWMMLPESRACRRPPFFDVCELAEKYTTADYLETEV